MLAQLGYAAYPTWARCLPRMGRIDDRQLPNNGIFIISVFLLSGFCQCMGKKNIAQEKDLSDILFLGYISLFHHLDDTWRHLAALDADEEDGSLDIGEGSKGRRDLSG